jgi:hypothetical protein
MAVSELPFSTDNPTNPSEIDETSDGITVEALPDVESLMGGILSAYRLKEFDAGYSRALSDIVNALVLESALYLRTRPDAAPDARRLVSAFATYLERRITALRPSSHAFVEDGLGI